jgi:hypothetical protein
MITAVAPARAQGTSPEDTSRGHPDTTVAAVPATTPSDSARRTRRNRPDTSVASYHPDTTTSRAPLAHAEQPPLLGAGQRYYWDREEIYASGAFTLADLLDRVPGFTGFRSGWISTPMVGSYFGDAARVRVFLDGIELDALDTRLRGTIDLATIQLWTLEEVAVERGAGEIRVYLRTWRVDRTSPYTRADVATGNDNTNLYRGYYGQRFRNGLAIQAGGEEFTDVGRYGGGGDETALMGRLGWARGRWSFDVFGERSRRGRDLERRINLLTGDTAVGLPLPNLEATRTDAYARAGYGDPDRGVWAQLVAATLIFQENSHHANAATAASLGVPIDTVDTATSQSQYVAAAGFTRWGIRFSATERLRLFGHTSISSPSARASFESGPLALSAFVERGAPSAWPTERVPERTLTVPITTVEAQARLTPLPFLSVAGAASRQYSSNAADAPPTSTALRAEASIHAGQLALTGGVMTRDTALVQGLSVYDTTFLPAVVGRVTGRFATAQGSIANLLHCDVTVIDWGSAGPYRPHYQTRAEAFISTEWLSKFPRHTFGIRVGGIFDYRTQTPFPVIGGIAVTQVEEAFTSYVEIRILQATLFWQDRNLNGYPYDLVPGFLMPRQLNIYGVRWHFWG